MWRFVCKFLVLSSNIWRKHSHLANYQIWRLHLPWPLITFWVSWARVVWCREIISPSLNHTDWNVPEAQPSLWDFKPLHVQIRCFPVQNAMLLRNLLCIFVHCYASLAGLLLAQVNWASSQVSTGLFIQHLTLGDVFFNPGPRPLLNFEAIFHTCNLKKGFAPLIPWVINLSSRETVFTTLNIHMLCTETFMCCFWCQQPERKIKMLVAGKRFNWLGLSFSVFVWDFLHVSSSIRWNKHKQLLYLSISLYWWFILTEWNIYYCRFQINLWQYVVLTATVLFFGGLLKGIVLPIMKILSPSTSSKTVWVSLH